jgi:ABC-type multidrug transport system fused ATPase/permease subunit
MSPLRTSNRSVTVSPRGCGMATLSPLLILLFLLLCLTSVCAQFSFTSTPGCPPGKDCVGQQIALRTSGNTPISCDPIQFAGFNCGLNVTAMSGGLHLCPSGFYCPSPTQRIECPSGYWCHAGSSSPTPCLVGSVCSEGQFIERYFLMLGSLIFVSAAVLIAYRVGHRIVARRAMERVENSKHAPATIAVQVRSNATKRLSANDGSFAQVKINIALKKICVQVKDDNSESVDEVNGGWAADSTTASALKTILRDVSCTLRGGRLTAVMGASGAGKVCCSCIHRGYIVALHCTLIHSLCLRASDLLFAQQAR